MQPNMPVQIFLHGIAMCVTKGETTIFVQATDLLSVLPLSKGIKHDILTSQV